MARPGPEKHPFSNVLPHAFILFLAVLALVGCAAREDGRLLARAIADAGGFSPVRLETAPFVLCAWLRQGRGDTLHVYIEGDGFAWKTPFTPSDDPTPHKPTGFRLAAADPTKEPLLYLGRPCQYTLGQDRRNCETAIWTDARYSPSVVDCLLEAVSAMKRRTGARHVALYGFSGGGALAALLAERRSDVVFLGTVAANLDVSAWCRHHKARPLHESLNPADRKTALADLPQLHISGEKDRICPPFLARDWCAGLARCKDISLPWLGHGGDWDLAWPELLATHRDNAAGSAPQTLP